MKPNTFFYSQRKCPNSSREWYENRNQVLPDFRLGWAENNRVACLDNLAPLSTVARAVTASTQGKPGDAAQVLRTAERLQPGPATLARSA